MRVLRRPKRRVAMRQPTVQPAPLAVRARMFGVAPTSRVAGGAASEFWGISVTLTCCQTRQLPLTFQSDLCQEVRTGLLPGPIGTRTAQPARGLVKMVKTIAKRMLASTVLRLPWGAREAIHDALCDRLGSTETMARAASRAGVTGISAPGRWGTIQSAASDRSILPVYARTGDWARRTHEALADFFPRPAGPTSTLAPT